MKYVFFFFSLTLSSYCYSSYKRVQEPCYVQHLSPENMPVEFFVKRAKQRFEYIQGLTDSALIVPAVQRFKDMYGKLAYPTLKKYIELLDQKLEALKINL